jgi:hypothetical protein
MSKFYNKISNLVNSQVPQFVLEDHPIFVNFLKAYFKYLESSLLYITEIATTDGVLLESETNQIDKLLLETGDKLVEEQSIYGQFSQGETIIGQLSKATSTILTVDLNNNRLFINSENKFIIGETIVGSFSNASATINDYKSNPLETIQNLLNYRDADTVIDKFLTHFQYELANTMPQNLYEGLNKKTMLKNIKFIYGLKGTREGNDLFFRLLFNERADTIYPGEQVLKVSAGNWNKSLIIRIISISGDTSNLIGRIITGVDSGATAIVEEVKKFQIGSDLISELTLSQDTIFGNFNIGEQIIGTQHDDDNFFIKASITGLPTKPIVTNGGSLYNVGDTVFVSGGGTDANIEINSVGQGSITNFFIDNGGSGYKIGDDIIFNNANTNGGAAVAKVSIVNGGLLLQDSSGDIILENATTSGDNYSGNILVQETATGNRDITAIRIINPGFNYTSLPLISVNSTGTGASIKVYGDNIGKVLSLRIIEPGKGYENSPSPPSLILLTNILFLNVSGLFSLTETITGLANDNVTTISAKIVNIDYLRNIITLSNATGIFGIGNTITGSLSGATATIKIFNQATASTTVTALLNSEGSYLDQQGWISENSMKIEDSKLYQDFSYIIKVARSIADWRDSYKKTMHAAGFYFSSEVDLVTSLNSKIKKYSSIINSTSYKFIIGRILGTLDDNKTLNYAPSIVFNNLIPKNTKFLILKHETTYTPELKSKLNVRNITTSYGYAAAGPRFRSINKFKFTTFSGSIEQGGVAQNTKVGANNSIPTTTYISPLRFNNLYGYTLSHTRKHGVDGQLVNLGDYNNYNLKINIALPSEITVSH